MSLQISSTKTFSGTSGNYSLSETFTAGAKASASESVPASSSTNIEVFASNAGTEIKFLAIKSSKDGSFQFKEADDTNIGSSVNLTAGVSKVYFGSALTSADFYGDADISIVSVTNSDSSASADVSIDILYDPTN